MGAGARSSLHCRGRSCSEIARREHDSPCWQHSHDLQRNCLGVFSKEGGLSMGGLTTRNLTASACSGLQKGAGRRQKWCRQSEGRSVRSRWSPPPRAGGLGVGGLGWLQEDMGDGAGRALFSDLPSHWRSYTIVPTGASDQPVRPNIIKARRKVIRLQAASEWSQWRCCHCDGMASCPTRTRLTSSHMLIKWIARCTPGTQARTLGQWIAPWITLCI